MLSQEKRRRLADRLLRYPLLSFLVMSPWFVAALGLAGAAVLLAALAAPKIWVTSPPDFRPEVKISVIDWVQNKMLRSRAARLSAAGNHAGARRAWIAAAANNPADVLSIRGSLNDLVLARAEAHAADDEVVNQAGWLLRLTGTNRQDVGLSACALEAVGLARMAVDLLRPQGEDLPPEEAAAYLRALFLCGLTDEFDRRWTHAPIPVRTNADLALCRAAYDAGWGPPEAGTEARRQLAAALDDPRNWPTACRARMVLANRFLDPEPYADALRRLELQRLDRLSDRLGYWRLLSFTGRKEEALRLAAATINPRSAREVLELSGAYRDLGMTEEANLLLKRSLDGFGDEPSPAGIELWLRAVDSFAEARLWDDLRSTALLMRMAGVNAALLTGFSRYAEGRASAANGHDIEAGNAFAEAVQLAWPNPDSVLRAAETMLRVNHPRPALDLLKRFAEPLESRAVYWQTVFTAAYALKSDAQLLLEAARKACDLAPENPALRSNYAAALLINRQAADEASKITFAFLQSNPKSLVAKVNHCFALAMNRRADEAEALLRTVDPTTLTDHEATVYHLCMLEINYQRGNWTECASRLARIDRSHLFPIQAQWLDQVTERISKAP